MTAEEAAAELARRWEASWNAHDMNAFAATHTEDTRFINRYGMLDCGRVLLKHRLDAVHRSVFRDCTMKAWVEHVEVVGEGVALVQLRNDLALGSAWPGGPGPAPCRALLVLIRQDDVWLIKAVANISMVNPMTNKPDPAL